MIEIFVIPTYLKKIAQTLPNKKNLFLAWIIVLFCAALFQPNNAYPQSIQHKRDQLNQTRKNLRTVRKHLKDANVRFQDISHQLHRTQRQITTLKTDISDLSLKIDVSKQDIKRLRKELAQLQKSYKEKQAKLQTRLRNIYLNQDNNNLNVIFSCDNFSDFANQTDYLSRICQNDEKIIKTLKIEQEALRFKQRQIDEKYHRMISYRENLKVKRESLKTIENKREDLLSDVEKERKYYQQRKYALEEHTQELENEVQNMIRSYQSRSYTSSYQKPAHSTGSYRWPADGPITSNFGWRVHPIYGTSRFHTGVDIGAYYGSPIKAADGGTVIYSGWCGGYGYTVMIDHGGGSTTLYGHCSRLFASVGQSVGKGQVVAAVGSTGNSTGPHLHFEVRQNGVPVSPWGYLR